MNRFGTQSAFVRGRSLLFILTTVPACAVAMQPLARGRGPSVSPEGVQVAVVGQRCKPSGTQYPDELEDDHADVEVKVEVRDATPSGVVVHRDRFRLVTPDGTVVSAVTWGLGDPLMVRGGEARSFELAFQPDGNLQCSQEMRLQAEASIFLHGSALKIGAVPFVPWGA
jgi:hypothetical protein